MATQEVIEDAHNQKLIIISERSLGNSQVFPPWESLQDRSLITSAYKLQMRGKDL